MFGRTRLLAVALAVSVCTGVIAVPQPVSAKPADASPSARARATGQPVEVPELTSDRTRVLANPNGRFTAELSARPVRVRTATGWVGLDTTLIQSGDAVKPKAAPLPVTLSGGGTGPLFTVTQEGRTLSYGWPASLPKPVLAKDIATYGEVLPGVDLKVRVTPDQVSYALVVKTRPAAADPALRAIRLTVAGAEGVQLGEAWMWDSTRNTVPGKEDPVEAARKPEDFVIAPRTGARTAKVTTTSAPGELVLQPDENLLSGKDTVFPVIIDPPTNLSYNWTMINARHPDQSYWSYDRDQAKVGYVEDYKDGWEKYRTILGFDTRGLRGKQILDAQLSATLNHSWYPSSVANVFAMDPIHPGTTWNNSVGWAERVASSVMGANNGPKYVEWKDPALRDKVSASVNADSLTFGIASGEEGEINKGWKKFDPNSFTLRVEYDSKPDELRDLMIDDQRSCVRGADRPGIANTTPQIKAIVSDADSDTLGMAVRMGKIRPDGSYDQESKVYDTTNVPSGTQAQVSVGTLESGTSYWFWALGFDGKLFGPASPTCEFTVDTTKPDKKPTVASADGMYPNDGKPHGGVGKTGTFTFGANGVGDVAGYRYGLADPPTDYVPADKMGGPATAGVTPENRNMNRLFVRSVDRAGNMGPVETYQFLAGRGTDPIGQWNLDEKSGTVLADASGKEHPATLSGGTTFTDSRTGGQNGAVNFNGSTGHAATSAPVLKSGTNFSVAAWVRLGANGTYQTAVSQDGDRISSMFLQYVQPRDRWGFAVASGDGNNAGATQVVSDVAPRLGAWTHLAGTYDAANKVARIYVNGRKAGESAIQTPWTGTGPLAIGRAKWESKPTDFWNGDIDDVRVWDRRVYESEIAEIVDQATLVGQWGFDEASGTKAEDASGYNRPLSMSGGAKRVTGHSDKAGQFGDKAFAASDKPVLRTDNSFTISTWARADKLDWFQTVLGQDGNRLSPFMLQYNHTSKRWAFVTFRDDADSTTVTETHSITEAKVGEWVHLTAVYDVRNRQARLYVNGQLVGTSAVGDLFQASGGFTVGRTKFAGNPADFFPGAIDDVRAYQGVLSDAEIHELSRQ
ncbi:LamG domain-containing protein [Pseudonocardiaceae bacterium YIM PH 21723]|nr:LamG domain-containing protein [Pseudonocardiaceae bacterium YIM PH 21723]